MHLAHAEVKTYLFFSISPPSYTQLDGFQELALANLPLTSLEINSGICKAENQKTAECGCMAERV